VQQFAFIQSERARLDEVVGGGGGGRTFNAEAPPTALNIITTAQHTRRVERGGAMIIRGEDVTYLFHLSCTLLRKKEKGY
jgi:hypothetical protein